MNEKKVRKKRKKVKNIIKYGKQDVFIHSPPKNIFFVYSHNQQCRV